MNEDWRASAGRFIPSSHLSCGSSFPSSLFWLALWVALVSLVGEGSREWLTWNLFLQNGEVDCWEGLSFFFLLTILQILPIRFSASLWAWFSASCQLPPRCKLIEVQGAVPSGGVLFEQVVSGNPRIFKETIKSIPRIVQVIKWDLEQERALKTTEVCQ